MHLSRPDLGGQERNLVRNYPLQDIQLSKSENSWLASRSLASTFALSGFGGQPSLTDAERRLVENTGLEPVTSWLQTRRSPS